MRPLSRASAALLTAALAALPLTASAAIDPEAFANQIASLLTRVADLQAQVYQLQAADATSTMIAPATASAAVMPESGSTTGAIVSRTLPSMSTSPTASSAGPVSLPAAACPAIARTLARGLRGDDVQQLQRYFVSLGLLASDAATGYFGALTEDAVQAWQSERGLVSRGPSSKTGLGIVGAKTRAAILARCGGAPLPQNDSLSIAVTNLDMQASLTLNTRGSCAAQKYTLAWGDGTAPNVVTVPAGSCAPYTTTIPHHYLLGGTYQAILSSTGYRIVAPLSLTDTHACVKPVFATDTIPAAVVGQLWNLPLFLSSDPSLAVTLSGNPGFLALSTSSIGSGSSTTYMWNVAGTPTTAGTYAFTYGASNQCGTASRTITLTVANRASAQ